MLLKLVTTNLNKKSKIMLNMMQTCKVSAQLTFTSRCSQYAENLHKKYYNSDREAHLLERMD